MIILSCCIIIFITYLAICGLLSYYFIKKRPIWNTLFSLEAICNTIKEIFVCPEHFVIWFPLFEFEETHCVLNKKIKDETKENIRKILIHIKKYINEIQNISGIGSSEISSNEVGSSEIGSNEVGSSNNIKKLKWLLDGTMSDFDRMYEENAEFYNKLAGSYDTLNVNNKHTISLHEGFPKSCLALEDLVVLENNIELCENISNILNVFCNSEYKLLLSQIESGYIKSLLYELIENVKIYKIRCMNMS